MQVVLAAKGGEVEERPEGPHDPPDRGPWTPLPQNLHIELAKKMNTFEHVT